MTTYTFPALSGGARLANSSSLSIISNTKIFTSPLTGAMQRASRAGSRWHLGMQFRNLVQADRALLQAFLARMEGQEHDFKVHDHSYVMRGAGGGTPLVDGASQTGSSLNIKGCPISETDWLKEGDQFAFSNGSFRELKMVTTDCSTDGSGDVTVNFKPPIRISPANEAAIDLTDPQGQFVLIPNENGWNNLPGPGGNAFSDFTIDAVELIV
jgi:hypothetical protein